MTDSAFNQFVNYGTNADRLAYTPSPPTPASGPLPLYIWYETDTGDTYAYDTAWHKINTGGGSDPLFIPPDVTLFTTILDPDSDSPAFTQEDIGAVLAGGVVRSGANIKGFFKAVPGTTPWTIDAKFNPSFTNTNHLGFGFFLRNSGSGRLVSFHMEGAGNNATINFWNSATSFDSNHLGLPMWPNMFYRIGFDGTDYTFFISSNNVAWFQVATIAASAWITADQIGIAINAQNDGGPPNTGNAGGHVTYYVETV